MQATLPDSARSLAALRAACKWPIRPHYATTISSYQFNRSDHFFGSKWIQSEPSQGAPANDGRELGTARAIWSVGMRAVVQTRAHTGERTGAQVRRENHCRALASERFVERANGGGAEGGD